MRDPRFAVNPFVVGEPFIRFYAGVQLRSPEGHAIGTRTRSRRQACCTFNGGRSTIECTIRGLSKNGAMLQVISTAGVPERFKLGVVSDELHRMCKIAHKRDTQIEVVFE